MICSNPNCGAEYKTYFTDDWNLCRICDMLQSGNVPSIKTEATFQAKAGLGGAQFHPGVRGLYLRRAAEAGVTTEGRVYDPRVAAYPGDPEAWVSSQDDVKRIIEKRGWSVEGDITVKGEKVAPNKSPLLADDILEEAMEAKLEEKLGPDFVEAKGAVVERARDDVLQQHAPPEFYKKVFEEAP